jgi:lipid-A-disaccharide synthase
MARIFLSAGEASGEQYAVQLIAALRGKLPDACFYGLGGERMAAAGFERIVRAEDVAVMGITEILRHVPKIYREYRRLRRSLDQPKPDIAVLIDFPDVNLSLAKRCKQLGIPVIFFVSPQVWAWKKHRLPRIRRDVDRMLVIFPFEEPWYRERGVDASFVGHPLAELPLPSISREGFAAAHQLDPSKQWVGLLPGSRAGEIALNLPEMLVAASELAKQDGNRFEFVLPLAPTLTAEKIQRVQGMIADATARDPKCSIRLTHDARAALYHARASIVASGTATVEAAVIGNPFVVVYRLSGASYAVARRFVKVPHVAMANLIAGGRVVPELIQNEFTGANVAAALRPLLDETPERAAMQQALVRVRLSLCEDGSQDGSAIEKVAGHVLSLLHASQTQPSPLLSPAI